MESLILPWLLWYQPLVYAILFAGMIVEGDAVLFIAGFLAHQGYISPLLAAGIALAGAFFGDTLWFRIGKRLRTSNSRFSRVVERLAAPFDQRLSEHPIKTIFLSKFAYGLNKTILIRSGWLGMSWKKLEESDLLAILLWIFIVGGLGYVSSASFSAFRHYFKFAEVGLGIGLIAFLVLEYFITKKTKSSR